MNTLTALLVDNEEKANLVLSERLAEWAPQVRVVGVCRSAMEALTAILLHKPDLLFLDIEMDGMNGLDLFHHLADIHHPPQCIMVTGRRETEVYREAKRLGVIDYIFKPLIKEELVNAIKNATDRIAHHSRRAQIESLISLTNTGLLTFPTRTGAIRCRPHEILYIKADKKECNLHLVNNAVHAISISFGKAVEQLENTSLHRIDRSHIVNLSYVRELSYYPPHIRLEYSGKSTTLEVSQEGIKAIKSLLL